MKVHIYPKQEGDDFIIELATSDERKRFAQRVPLTVEDSGGFEAAFVYEGDDTTKYTDIDALIAVLQKD